MRAVSIALGATLLLALPARAQDAALGGAAVGADAGAYLGASFSTLPYYRDGAGTIVGALAGSVLGTLGLAPVGATPPVTLATPPAARPPVSVHIECRNFTDTMDVDGKQVEVKGLACKQPDGSWKVSP